MGSFFENPLDSLRIASVRTVQLTIAGVGGSIVTQSGEEMVGDVAQLVERRNGIAEATGSTPVVSTNPAFGDFWAGLQIPCFFSQFHYIDAPSEASVLSSDVKT